MNPDQFLEVKHEGCVVGSKARAPNREGTKAVRWARMVEKLRGNTMMSLTDLAGSVLRNSDQTCVAFLRQFVQQFGEGGESTMALDFVSTVRIRTSCRGSRQLT